MMSMQNIRRAGDLGTINERLGQKVSLARNSVPKPVIHKMDGAEIGIISMGSADPAVDEARDQLKARESQLITCG